MPRKFRPLSGFCAGVCYGTFGLASIACLIAFEATNRHGESGVVWLLPLLFGATHLVLVAYSVWRWNTPVFLYEDRITQMQWRKEVTMLYGEIEKIRISKYSPVYLPTVTVCFGRQKITFSWTKVKDFQRYCTNREVNDRIDLLQKN